MCVECIYCFSRLTVAIAKLRSNAYFCAAYQCINDNDETYSLFEMLVSYATFSATAFRVKSRNIRTASLSPVAGIHGY